MKSSLTVVLLLFIASLAFAGKTKTVEKRVTTTPQQRIELSGMTGSNITFRSWAKDEVYVKLTVRASSSDAKYEDDYIGSFSVNEIQAPDLVRLTIHEQGRNKDNGSWLSEFFGSLFGGFSINREISGEVFIPQKNSLTTDLRYGTIALEGIPGELRLLGAGNSLSIRSCTQLREIENDYGKTRIEDSGGSLKLRGTSSTITVSDFAGSLTIEANYSTVSLGHVAQDVSVTDQSGEITVDNVGGNVTLNADYSTINVSHVKGFAAVRSTSGTVKVREVGGVEVKADYSTIDINDVKGTSGKRVFVRSSSGRLMMEDIIGDVEISNPYSTIDLRRIAGNITLATTSGNIETTDITGDWSSTTEYSTISLRGLNARSVVMSNSSGLITVLLKSVPSAMTIRNQYGSVHAEMPNGFSGSLELDAEYGSIDTNLPLSVKSRGGSALGQGTLGTGAGTISIRTTSGNIDLIAK